MEGHLDKTVRHPIMKLLVDFNNLGYSKKDEWTDITDDVIEISGSKEKSGNDIGSVTSDIATFSVDNTTKKYNNDNNKSPLYRKIKSNLKFRLLTGFQGETLVPYASGYIESFTPAWRDKRISIKTTDYFKLFKEEKPPETGFQDISWDALVNILCDTAGLPSFIVRHIPKTEFYYSYFKFEEDNCFEALKSLMAVAVGEAYFEQEQFYVKTKLALDYQLDTTVDHDITVDHLFDFEENVDNGNIINSLEIKSEYKTIAPIEVVFKTPENITKVENELITYDGSGSIYVDPNNLPIIHKEDVPFQLVNITQLKNVQTNGEDPLTGRVVIHPDSLADVAAGDTLSFSYSYQQLALLPGKTRRYVCSLEEEIDSLQALDISIWDETGTVKMQFSDIADTADTVSMQGMTFDSKTNTVTLTIKNNYSQAVTISTLQFRGYPIKVISPIDVFVKDLPSIDEFGKKDVSIQNNYFNNVKLVQKVAQYIVDNNKQNRKRIEIEIPGYSDFSLDDVSKVTESGSGTNHKFTNERIDYSFTIDNGWTVKANLVELDSAPWVYESFKGESWQRTNPGAPDNDFLKNINANLIKNGGAELYTGFADKDDIGAIEQKHIIPDYWQFTRTSGNASSRIRDGGNLVIHGSHSFEITTSNSGKGYFEQIIKGIKPNDLYSLSLEARLTSCSGKASVFQYSGSTLLQTDSITITTDGPHDLTITSLASTDTIVVRIEKLAGTAGSESFVFDKVKFENSEQATIYIENEETTAVQVGQRYANSLVIGNNYGIEVLDNLDRSRVKLGQYAPGKFGLQIDGGAIEIVGGLPDSQIKSADSWNSNSGPVDLSNYPKKEDLRYTAPLPNSISLDANGITAKTSDPNKYARLDYRGLYVKGGAIQIDGGLDDTQIANSGKWNKNGTYIDQNGVYTGKISFQQGEGTTLKLGQGLQYGDGDLQVWADSNGDGIPDIIGRIDWTGAFFPLLKADNIVGNVVNIWTKGNTVYYVDCDNGNDSNDGLSQAKPKKNVQQVINSIAKNLNGANITVYAKGSFGGTIYIQGFKNGTIGLCGWDGNNALNTNHVLVEYCDRVLVQDVTIWGGNNSNDFSDVSLKANYCHQIDCYGVTSRNATHGFWMHCSNFIISLSACFSTFDRGLYATNNSQGVLITSKGNPTIAILSENGAIVNGYGSRWDGGLVSRNAGTIHTATSGDGSDTWSVIDNGGTAPAPTPPTTQTLSLAPTTGDNWSTSGYWENDSIKQGDWGYGTRYGIWYVDLSAIKGKTIDSATITVYRNGGGTNAGRNVHFRTHGYTSRGSRPGGAPAMSGEYVVGTIAVGETKTFDIKTMIQNNIANGIDKSIGIYTTGSTDYMSLGLTPSINITYH